MAAANCSLSRAPEKPQLTSRLKRYHLLLSRAVLAQETFQGPNDHLDVNMFNILHERNIECRISAIVKSYHGWELWQLSIGIVDAGRT